jgi:hypothetical protein
MNVFFAMFLSLSVLLGGVTAASAAVGSGTGDIAAPVEPVPVPPADIGPPPPGQERAGPGVAEIIIGTIVIGGAFAAGFATEGGLSAAIASAAAVLLIYSILP